MKEIDPTKWFTNSQEKKEDYIYILEQEELAKQDLEREEKRWLFKD